MAKEVHMPSGSHGGSRGSHSSGGARSGGSSYGSRGSSSRNYKRVFIIGGVAYGLPAVWNTRYNRLSTLVSLFAFFLFISIMVIVAGTSSIDNIKVDYMYYDDMIAQAETDNRYIVEGVITDKSLGEGGKWFFDYVFPADDGWNVPGYTYSIYTYEEIKNFSIGETILLATNSINTTWETDSIPLVCKGVSYEQDGSYAEALTLRNCGIGFTCTFAAGIVLVIVGQILIVKKHKTLSPQEEKSLSAFTKKTRVCSYCGSALADSDMRCRSCGAKAPKEKI